MVLPGVFAPAIAHWILSCPGDADVIAENFIVVAVFHFNGFIIIATDDIALVRSTAADEIVVGAVGDIQPLALFDVKREIAIFGYADGTVLHDVFKGIGSRYLDGWSSKATDAKIKNFITGGLDEKSGQIDRISALRPDDDFFAVRIGIVDICCLGGAVNKRAALRQIRQRSQNADFPIPFMRNKTGVCFRNREGYRIGAG